LCRFYRHATSKRLEIRLWLELRICSLRTWNGVRNIVVRIAIGLIKLPGVLTSQPFTAQILLEDLYRQLDSTALSSVYFVKSTQFPISLVFLPSLNIVGDQLPPRSFLASVKRFRPLLHHATVFLSFPFSTGLTWFPQSRPPPQKSQTY
jgi:hypothetical protein